jgi:UDP-2,3-diacylglucosamine pyrophosphatase LpxH
MRRDVGMRGDDTRGVARVAATAVREGSTGTAERRLVFISDLHLASDEGKRDFFAQDELTALLEELIADPGPIDLIIAGDFFDLLQLTGATPGIDRVAAFRRAFERRDYERMLDALRRFNRTPGRRTIYLVGNHDAEAGWNDPLRAHLLDSGLVTTISLAYAHTYTDDAEYGCLIYSEHGNEYDGVNAIGDYRNPTITPLGSHIVTDGVNYLEPLGRHADSEAPTSIADIDNIHPLGMIPWWFISTYFYQQVRRVTKYLIAPGLIVYLLFHLLPLYVLFEQFRGTLLGRGFESLPSVELLLAALIIMFDSSLLMLLLVYALIRFDFSRTHRRYGLQDPDDIFRRGARHYRRTCEALVTGNERPAHWPEDQPWDGTDLFVYGHTHTQNLTTILHEGGLRAFANTGTWTRKVIRIRANLKLPPVFVPTYELSYITVERVGEGVRATLWERPKVLIYRLPWTERLAILFRVRPPMRPVALAPHIVTTTILPLRAGVGPGDIEGPLGDVAYQQLPIERLGD